MYRNVLSLVLCMCLCVNASYAHADSPKERLDKLAKALRSNNTRLRLRATNELGQMTSYDKAAQKILVDYLFDAQKSIEWAFGEVKALSRSDPGIVGQIIDACGDPNSTISKRNLRKALFVLGSLGLKAQEAKGFLLKQLDRQNADPEMEGAIRVVLANVGYRSDENLRTILADIKNRTTRGNAEVAQMGRCGAGPWITDEIIAELVKWLDIQDPDDEIAYIQKSGETYWHVSLALASIGPRAKAATDKLQKHLKYMQSLTERGLYPCTVQILYNICLAKVDPSQFDKAIKTVIRWMRPNNDYWDHTSSYTVYVATYLFDARVIKLAGECLYDTDPEIVGGALWMLWRMGLDAKQFAPDVLKILTNNPEKDLRELAARVLKSLLTPEDIPALEQVMESEKSESVRTKIAETVRILDLEE